MNSQLKMEIKPRNSKIILDTRLKEICQHSKKKTIIVLRFWEKHFSIETEWATTSNLRVNIQTFNPNSSYHPTKKKLSLWASKSRSTMNFLSTTKVVLISKILTTMIRRLAKPNLLPKILWITWNVLQQQSFLTSHLTNRFRKDLTATRYLTLRSSETDLFLKRLNSKQLLMLFNKERIVCTLSAMMKISLKKETASREKDLLSPANPKW